MLTRRRLLICLLSATLLIVPVGGWVAWRMIPVPTQVQAYERLRLGMTLGEVEKVIGAPPGLQHETLTQANPTLIHESGIPFINWQDGWPNSGEPTKWVWKDFWIWVLFDDDGKAVGLYLFDSNGQPESPLGRLRKLIGI
jgi:hypothetical protein